MTPLFWSTPSFKGQKETPGLLGDLASFALFPSFARASMRGRPALCSTSRGEALRRKAKGKLKTPTHCLGEKQKNYFETQELGSDMVWMIFCLCCKPPTRRGFVRSRVALPTELAKAQLPRHESTWFVPVKMELLLAHITSKKNESKGIAGRVGHYYFLQRPPL